MECTSFSECGQTAPAKRPHRGKAKLTPVTQQAPAQSERDTLALQVAEILQTMFMAAAYNDNEGPRELHNSHLNTVDHLLGLLLAPECHDRASEDPALGETREHLALIASELEFAAVLMEERELSGVPLPTQAAYGAIVRHAAEYADRLFMAYCADSLDDLRHLTTFAGMRPFRDRPQPPIRRIGQEDAPQKIDIEGLASEALSIGLAIDWIIQANTILERIHVATRTDKGLLKTLQDHDIRFSAADWDACQMEEHIGYSLTRQHVLIKQMAAGAA